jgi:enediyne biosynthesis protein E4
VLPLYLFPRHDNPGSTSPPFPRRIFSELPVLHRVPALGERDAPGADRVFRSRVVSVMMLRFPLPLLLLLALAGCRSGDEDALFRLLPASHTGITFANTLAEDDSVYNPLAFDYLYNGAGVAVGDFNNNGLQDIFFGGNMVSSRLYLNQGDFRFQDATGAAGVGTDVWVTGVTAVDINQDGWLDLYVSVAGPDENRRANLLFVNQGPDANGVPRFVEQAEQWGLADTGYSTHAVFFDYDGDGLLDMYLLTNALEQFNRNALMGRRLNGEAASTDRLYRNNGDGTFSDVSREAGILTEGYGLGVVVADLNQDGWPDVYVANDFISNDLVWINNGDGTFTNRAAEYLRIQSHNSMGVDIADIDHDGLPEIMVVDMLPRDNFRKKMMAGGATYDVFTMGLMLGYEPQYVRNTLQLHNGFSPGGTPNFSEVGQLARVHDTDWSWAPLFSDFDNSGRRDLFITNGYRRDVTNLDFITYSHQWQNSSDPQERRSQMLRAMRELDEVKLPNYVFRNDGDLAFTDVTREWGHQIPSYSTGAVFVDLNNDGALDLVVSNIDGEAFVFQNRARELHPERNFLRVSLRGPAGNRGGYGAKVTIHTAEGLQYHDHTPYRGYKSSVEQTIHFGLGTVARVDSIEVRWPDGSYGLVRDVGVNQVLALDHRDAGPYTPRGAAAPQPLFQALPAGSGLQVAHESERIADFKHTPLLPHKHSQNGPGIAVGDVTGNGLDDVYVGTGRGQEKAVLLQTEPGRFVRRVLDADPDFEDMGALFFDANGNGHLDLYVVSGGGFLPNFPREYRDRLYLNDGRGGFRWAEDALPEVDASGSCVVAADFTGDGRLDLFVCGRVVPGEYPTAPRSYLLRNDTRRGGPVRFTDVTEELAPGLARVGLASDALWTDFDGDGNIDLIVVGEWMPITFFRNQGGRLVDVTASTGLGATGGWWNGIVAGDFTNNGRTDYVVGNLGLNTELRASPAEPMRLHAADFDGNGSIDPVLSYYIQGRSYPAHGRDQMIDQMVAMKARFLRFTDYGNATLDRVLTREEQARATVHEAVTLESVLLENLGGGRFAMRPLPRRAQFAPVFGMLARDFDGDGNLDVLLVGNSLAAEPRIGWYTASTGTLLLGDGAGGFRPVESRTSGFFVDGDAKGIAEVALDDERSLVLVTQNNDSLKAFQIRAPSGTRSVRLQPGDTHALLTLRDGRQRREEFHHGSAYLSGSSRRLRLPPDVERAVIHDARGGSREARVEN